MLGLSGLYAPIVSPFTDDGGSVSEIRLARLVRHLLEHGVAGFVCCTETGEFTTVNTGERKEILELLVREAHGVPVLAHCTRLGTAQSIDLCQHAARHGAKAAVVMPPYFGRFSDEEIEQYIRRVVQHAGLPVIVVDPSHLVRSSIKEKLENLAALHYAETTEGAFRTRFAVDPIGAGSDEFVFEDAVVSPLVQIDPKAAQDPGVNLRPIAQMIGAYGRPRVAKAALNERDIEVGPPRSPVLPLPHEQCQELAALVQTE
ncbi:MAG: dihydrodipicolinate synthase family protein [Fimbriimonadales bacterium]